MPIEFVKTNIGPRAHIQPDVDASFAEYQSNIESIRVGESITDHANNLLRNTMHPAQDIKAYKVTVKASEILARQRRLNSIVAGVDLGQVNPYSSTSETYSANKRSAQSKRKVLIQDERTKLLFSEQSEDQPTKLVITSKSAEKAVSEVFKYAQEHLTEEINNLKQLRHQKKLLSHRNNVHSQENQRKQMILDSEKRRKQVSIHPRNFSNLVDVIDKTLPESVQYALKTESEKMPKEQEEDLFQLESMVRRKLENEPQSDSSDDDDIHNINKNRNNGSQKKSNNRRRLNSSGNESNMLDIDIT